MFLRYICVMKSVYLNIKAIRIAKGLTQQELGKKIGLAQGNYTRLERGITQMTFERLEEIAAVFEMSPNAVIEYDTDIEVQKEDINYLTEQIRKLEYTNFLLSEELNGFKMEKKREIVIDYKTLELKEKDIEHLEKVMERSDKTIEERDHRIGQLEEQLRRADKMLDYFMNQEKNK